MRQVIAGTYEVEKEIGSGGGGVVYLARHLRLQKWVVVKADRRHAQTARPEVLRREVDALKNLSHTYIPQVYDYVLEDGAAYTVMDYIEGESLDKKLARGERFPQPLVIEWACELLEALCYLHSRPPHGILHGDIKPANIMVTPQNEIRLIDFNIALALGEEGAVRVGFSRGYASPEHYGVDYRRSGRTKSPETVLPLSGETILEGESQSRGTTSGSMIRLDVRSDIYSLGASLYHLLGGTRPSQDAKEVVPLSAAGVSPAVAGIIGKAMQPAPEDRYQTAREMLDALESLYPNDPRTKRLRRKRRLTAVVLAACFLLGGGMTFAGQGQLRQAEEQGRLAAEAAKEAEQTAKEALEAVERSREALKLGDMPAAAEYAAAALSEDTPYAAQAQKALTDALGVYDLFDGWKDHLTVELPSEVLKLAVSPEGTRAALLYAFRIAVVDTQTGERLAELPAQPTAAVDLLFLDEETLLFPGEKGVESYNIPAGRSQWVGQTATRLALSGDRSRVAGVDRDQPWAVLYDCAGGAEIARISFGGRSQPVPAGGGILADPRDGLLALNGDGTLLAVSFEDGGLSVFSSEGQEKKVLETSGYRHFEGGFSGEYLAYSAWNNENCVCAVIDTRTMKETIRADSQTPIRLYTDESGIYVVQGGVAVRLDPLTGEQREVAYLSEDITAIVRESGGSTLVSTGNGSYAFFDPNGSLVTKDSRDEGCEELGLSEQYAMLASRETPVAQILKQKRHPEARLCSYDPSWQHSEARLSADGETVTLFQYDRFYILSRQGELLAQQELPDPLEVYDEQFRREGADSWLEVLYRDGRVMAYSARDGSLLWERQEAPYSGSLEERFETSRWEIRAPLHETPTVYDKETGETVGELEKDSYLTYVTEAGGCIVTQYLSGQGERYGLLLDQDCGTLAYLPGLCDVIEETLVFDDGKGNLRQSRIYSLPELLALANNKNAGG